MNKSTLLRPFKLIICGTFILLAFNGCLKSSDAATCTNKTPESEKPTMQAYAAANNMTATIDPSGVFYQVVNPGMGNPPSATSTIYVKYTGRLVTTNDIFEQQNDPSRTGYIFNQLIGGWQIALSKIGKGGSIRMIIPSAYAYGCKGKGVIPVDAVLYFDVELVDIIF